MNRADFLSAADDYANFRCHEDELGKGADLSGWEALGAHERMMAIYHGELMAETAYERYYDRLASAEAARDEAMYRLF